MYATLNLCLLEGQRDITVPETLEVVFDENNGKLVLISGKLVIEDPLIDKDYGISINCVKLRRVVQVKVFRQCFIKYFRY